MGQDVESFLFIKRVIASVEKYEQYKVCTNWVTDLYERDVISYGDYEALIIFIAGREAAHEIRVARQKIEGLNL